MRIDTKNIVNLDLEKDERILDFRDFQKQNIKFDINKLQEAYNQIVQTKKFEDGGGIAHFGAISLTQIPGDPESVKGSKARGVYWTKPDKSGKEVTRDVMIDESAYSEFIKDYENTYFKCSPHVLEPFSTTPRRSNSTTGALIANGSSQEQQTAR